MKQRERERDRPREKDMSIRVGLKQDGTPSAGNTMRSVLYSQEIVD